MSERYLKDIANSLKSIERELKKMNRKEEVEHGNNLQEIFNLSHGVWDTCNGIKMKYVQVDKINGISKYWFDENGELIQYKYTSNRQSRD